MLNSTFRSRLRIPVRIFLINLFCAMPALTHAEMPFNGPDWSQFMERQNVLWEIWPEKWGDAPYAGNGYMGVYTYFDDEENALMFVISRMDAYDARNIDNENSNPVVTARGRLPNGRFKLSLPEGLEPGGARLDLWNGTYEFTFINDGQEGAARVFAHPAEDVVVVSVEGLPMDGDNWTWLPDQAVSLRDPEIFAPYPPQYQQAQDGVSVSIQDLPEGEEYDNVGEGTAQNATAWTMREEGGVVHALISQAFSRPGTTAAQTAVETLEAAEAVSIEDMRETTANWWHEFLTKSYISLPDPRAEQFFWLQMHRIGATVREHGPMVDLSGPAYPWNHRYNKKAGSYTVRWPGIWWNWNQQGAYTPFHKANHPRLGFNQDHGLWKYRESLEKNAGVEEGDEPRYTVGDRGGIDLLAHEGSLRNNANLAWALFNSWEIYDSIRDEEHLRDVLYPLMVGNLRHIETSFIERDGVYHLPHNRNPEYSGGADLSYEIAAIRSLCRNIIEAETRLENHQNLTPRCQEILEKLVDYHIDPEEGIMIAEGQKYDTAHRHFSHIIGIYQLRELHATSEPEKAELARKSVEHWDEVLHAPKEGETGRRIPGNAWPDFGTAGLYAVLDDAENAHLNFQNALQSMHERSTITHMTTSAPINETPFFAARVLMDLLVQTRDGEILIFPATPSEWADAVFHNLRLPGAFLVSARREGGATQWVRIKSEAGEPCIVRHTLPGEVQATGSREFTVTDKGNGFVEIDLQAGEEVLLYTGQAPAELNLAPVEHTLDTPKWGLRKDS